ncbi:hypothetical protein HOD29_04110 [archaeon]|jgi:hypothetical protein|nr:hypothetical protein [archaeon]
MGKIIELDTDLVIPSQAEMSDVLLQKFLVEYFYFKKDILVPIKKSNIENKFYLIDGHHRASSIHLLKKLNPKFKMYGWIVEDKNDFIGKLPQNFYQQEGTIRFMNRQIFERFENVENYLINYPKSIEDLCGKYGFMKSPEIMLDSFFSREEITDFFS